MGGGGGGEEGKILDYPVSPLIWEPRSAKANMVMYAVSQDNWKERALFWLEPKSTSLRLVRLVSHTNRENLA
jgi:hypothetical protein